MYQGANINRKRNPRERAGLFRILFFLYTLDIFRKSRKRDLVEDDLYEPLQVFQTTRIGDKLEHEWTKEVTTGRNSLSRALFRVFGKVYIIYGFGSLLVRCALMTVNPLMMGKLVSYFSPESTMSRETACIYGGLLILAGMILSLYNHHYHLMMSSLGIQVKASLTSLIYRKSLRLTSASLMELTSGKLVTIISKDAGVFESAMNFFHDLWIGLFQLLVMTFILYRQVQEATFIGVGFLLFLFPVQIYIAKFTKVVRLKSAGKSDERLKRMQEILTSIKLLKLYNWTNYYTKLTNQLRTEEMKKLRIIFYLKAVVLIMSQLSQRVSFFACIMFYISQGSYITAEKVFIILGCYSNLRYFLTIALPMSVSQFAEARSAMKRIKQCLLIQDVPELSKEIPRGTKIQTEGATVTFCDQKILQNVTFQASSGSIIGITGNVGSGKSTFLKMLLKEMQIDSGYITICGTVSYASQDPWLFPGSIKQNILFGQSYDKERYQEVLRCCSLVQDLEGFALKDNTVVNDKGLNLSKGQQARINLARAVYKNADIYLLDDVMVSLDSNVSKEIFKNCFQNFLQGKLILLVCHNKKFLKMTDKIVVFKQGQIEDEGQYEDLVKKGIDFTVDTVDSTIESTSPIEKIKEIIDDQHDEEAALLKSVDHIDQRLYQEHREVGKVKLKVYKTYMDSAGGWKMLVLVLLIFVAAQSFTSYFDYYVTNWIKVEEHISRLTYNITNNLTNITIDSEIYSKARESHDRTIYVYSFLIGMSIISVICQLFTYFGLTSRASREIHNKVFEKVTSATMNFFDQNLSGNILNRFSKDIATIDEQLPYTSFEALRVLFFIGGISIVIIAVSPMLTVPTFIILIILLFCRRSFLIASRSLKRLDGTTRAPVIGFLNSCLEGLPTIRASGNQTILIHQFERHVDLNSSTLYMYYSITRAFGLWLDTLCKIYITIIVFLFIFLINREEGAGGRVGVVLAQAFGLMGLLQWGIRQWAELENVMTCVERLSEYSDAEQEKQSGLDPDNWPMKGHIEYRNVTLAYFHGKPVLTNVCFDIKPGERIGIIGRTGAGKSSIISALFRLYNIKGSVYIDDFDIKDLELPIVRSKISIIPQDPVLFAGTIRTNLDPENHHTDMQLWNTLAEVELKYDIECLKEGLSSIVQEGGGNFSIGQRQLICLARAILRDNKILVLDEATANIDPATDALIQTTIKRLFAHCTILTIAHRLHTIIDSDRIIVVDNGAVVDFDTPQALIQRRHGIFYGMAKQVGLAD